MRLVTALMLAGVLCGSGAQAQKIVLARGGKAEATIVLASSSSPSMRHGAEELQRYLKQITGADFSLVVAQAGASGDVLPKSLHTVIYVADDAVLARQEGRAPALAEEYRIRTRPSDRLGPTRVEISGGATRGAMYGCYAFLEDVLGCRWFTSKISRIPYSETLAVDQLDIREHPAFEYREPYYTEAFDGDWAARNRANGANERLDAAHGGRVQYGRFVHTFHELVPPEKYYETHPEYFSLVDGKRQNGYSQLCLTNPDVLRIAIETVKKWIRENPDATIFSVSQNDTAGYCQCDRCRAVEKEEGAPSGVVLRFVNAIADAVAQEHPHVLIDTLAYQWTETPPRVTKPRPNVRIRIAPISACVGHALDGCSENKTPLANLKAWARITNQLYIWHYSTNFANYLQPLPDLDEIPADIRLFRNNGVVGIFYEGGYGPGGGCEMAELKAYLMAKLLWNPDRPATPIISDFLDGVYGKAAPYIQRWLDALHRDVRAGSAHPRIYDPPTAPYLTDDLLTEGTHLFEDAAKVVADDPVALEQVQRARLSLDYVRLMRSADRYVVDDGVYRAPAASTRAARMRRFIDRLNQFGIGEVSEGGSVADFAQRMLKPAREYRVLSIESPTLHVDVVPELGGRILRLVDRKSGRNLLREALPSDPGYPAAGGYEEYSTADYRSPGWSEAYTGEVTTASTSQGTAPCIHLKVDLPNGLRVDRTLTLAGDRLTVRTRLTNTSAKPVTALVRVHPEFAVPTDATPQVRYTDQTGRQVELAFTHAETDTFLENQSLPNGAWTVDLVGITVTQRFDPKSVRRALVNGAVGGGRVNLELLGVSRTLKLDDSVELEHTLEVARDAGKALSAGASGASDATR